MADLIEGRAVDQRHGIGVAEDGLPWSPLGVPGEEQHIITDLECEDQAGVVDRVVQAGDRGEQVLFAGVADVDDRASRGSLRRTGTDQRRRETTKRVNWQRVQAEMRCRPPGPLGNVTLWPSALIGHEPQGLTIASKT